MGTGAEVDEMRSAQESAVTSHADDESELVCGNRQLVGPMGIMNQRVNAGNDQARGEVSGSCVDLLQRARYDENLHESPFSSACASATTRSISSKHILPSCRDAVP